MRAKKTEKEKAEKGGDLMDMDNPPPEEGEQAEKMETDEKEELVEDGKKKRKAKKDEEPQFEVLSNLSRVVPQQLKYITFPEESRYVSIKRVPTFVNSANYSLPAAY